jgi:hypothetical protein
MYGALKAAEAVPSGESAAAARYAPCPRIEINTLSALKKRAPIDSWYGTLRSATISKVFVRSAAADAPTGSFTASSQPMIS